MCNACEEIQVRQILSLFSAQTNPIGSNGGEGPLVSAALIQKAHLVSLFPALESWERTPHPPVIQRKPIFVAVARAAATAVTERSDGLLKPSLVSLSCNAKVSSISSALETRGVDCLG